LAFSKQYKGILAAQYVDWLKNSQAVFVLEYSKMGMKQIDTMRAKVRDAGGQVHVVKNTVMQRALEQAGITAESLEGSLLFGFAFNDPPALAKVLVESTAKSEVFKLKGGYMGGHAFSAAGVKTLAELPPLPVMRAKLLGVISAPASKLVRTLVEPSRQVARAIKAYAEMDAIPAAA
jgi:large subunit ribosomal protein L10